MKKFKHRLLAFVVAFCAFVSGINAQPIIIDDFSTASSLNNWDILPPLRPDIVVLGSNTTWDNGKLKMQTAGGSNGWWGEANSTRIGPNYSTTPTNWTNTETEFRIEELPRNKLNGYKDCVIYSYIIRLDDNNYISIELNGNHYGYDFITVPGHPYGVDNAHRLLLRTPTSRQHILNQSLILGLNQDYIYDFRIKNLNNVWSVSYKQSNEINWQMHTISGLTNPSGLATVQPYFMIWSGDGGNTFQNASGAFNIDYYKVYSIATILPLELLSFDAEKKEDTVLLDWKTSNEQNTSHFNIQRSTDGTYFSTIGKVTSNNKTTLNDYRFEDKNLPFGTLYYRLEQVDRDEKTTFSPIRSVEKSDKFYYNLSPNPTQDILSINGNADYDLDMTIDVFNEAGANVYQKTAAVNSGTFEQKIDMTAFPEGAYIVLMRLPNGFSTKKTVVKVK